MSGGIDLWGGLKSSAEVTVDGSLFLGLVLLGGSFHRRRWLDRIGLIAFAGYSGSYRLDCIGWIVSAGLYRLDCIGWIVSVSVLGLLG